MVEALGPDHPDVANVLVMQGRIWEALDRPNRAKRCYQRSYRIMVRFDHNALNSSIALAKILIQTQYYLGDLKRREGHYKQAGQLLKRAARNALRYLGKADLEAAIALNMLGMWCKFTGNFDLGRRCYLLSRRILAKQFGKDHLNVAAIYHNLGGLEHERGDYRRAERYARASVQIRIQHEGEHSPGYAADAGALATILACLGKLEEASRLLQAVLAIWHREYGPEHYEVAVTLHNLAAIEAKRNELDAAEANYRESERLKALNLGEHHPDLALTRHNLAVLLYSMGKRGEASHYARSSREVFIKNLAPDHPNLEHARKLALALDPMLQDDAKGN
jgi:tetratricopeptide (TPR) repeat protein